MMMGEVRLSSSMATIMERNKIGKHCLDPAWSGVHVPIEDVCL